MHYCVSCQRCLKNVLVIDCSVCLLLLRIIKRRKKLELLLNSIKSTPCIASNRVNFESVLGQIDRAFEEVIRDCYLDFQAITEALLNREQAINLANIYKNKLPRHCNLMKELLGFDQKNQSSKKYTSKRMSML